MQLIFKINKPVETVLEYLTNMDQFVLVHPVITGIDHIKGNNYLVHETLRILFIPLAFTYTVSVQSDVSKNSVLISAMVMGKTAIEMKYVLTGSTSDTMVNETIFFYAPFPVKWMLKKIFRKQHAALFRNICAVK